MITDGTSNWHYLAIKNISGLLREITSNHNGLKKNHMKVKSYVMYAIKNFVPIIIKKSEKLGIIAIMQGNIEALHTGSVI